MLNRVGIGLQTQISFWRQSGTRLDLDTSGQFGQTVELPRLMDHVDRRIIVKNCVSKKSCVLSTREARVLHYG